MKINIPQVFIASSTEGLDIAYSVQDLLDNNAECTVWDQGVFQPSSYTIPDLIKQLEKSDYGIFIFSPDDELIIRNKEEKAIRDNVILELGLFMGALGPKNCFIIMPKSTEAIHLPTDLTGMTLLKFNSNRSDDNIKAALGPVISQIRNILKKYGSSDTSSQKQMIKLSDDVVQQINFIGLSAFYSSRDDYAKHRINAASIDKYIDRAQKSITIVSITLTTGLSFDDICKVIENKIKNIKDFKVTISLLNPFLDNLYFTISPLFGQQAETLQKNTKDALVSLRDFRAQLSDEEQKRFILKVHNTLPFGSAIILDGDLESGTIQIETKPYKVGIRKSFAFEICNNNRSFYNTLKTSYYSLITDGLSQDDLFSKL